MSSLPFTHHAISRMSQRGIDLDDIEIVEWIGTEVEGGYLVRQKDFQAVDRELKRLRDQMRRLVGKRLVREGLTVVTAYHACRGKQRRLLRNAEERCVDQTQIITKLVRRARSRIE